jgi:hypothetical protein
MQNVHPFVEPAPFRICLFACRDVSMLHLSLRFWLPHQQIRANVGWHSVPSVITQLSDNQLHLDFKGNTSVRAVPQLKRLVAGFPSRRTEFEPGLGNVGFVVDKVALGQVFSKYFGFPCQSFHQLLHTHHRPSSRPISRNKKSIGPWGPKHVVNRQK